MCKALSPSVFLALVFRRYKKNQMQYQELENCRKKITQLACDGGESYDVDWNHDSVQFTMGFYSPVFKEGQEGVTCDLDQLEHFYPQIVSSVGNEGELESLARAFS